MRAPGISVVIPTFNRAKVLERCLQSVLGQTLQPLEVLVVDDGSTDGTEQVVQAQASELVRYIRLPHRGGAQAARNRGIREAQGEWIAFQDSDDEWLPDKLERQVALIEDEWTVVHGSGLAGDKTIGRRLLREEDALAVLLRGPATLFPALLVSRAALERIGPLDEELPAFQEWDTSIRLARFCRLVAPEEPVFTYRLGTGDAISDSRVDDVRGYQYVIEKFRDEIVERCGEDAWNAHLLNQLRRSLEFELWEEAGTLLPLVAPRGSRFYAYAVCRRLRVRPSQLARLRRRPAARTQPVRIAHVANTTARLSDLLGAATASRRLPAVERALARELGVSEIVLFASARGALRAAFVALAAKRVVIPAYTCVAVPNAAISAGVPVAFADVDELGLLDLDSLPQPDDDDAVLVQDTYGFPAALPGGGRAVRDASHRVDLVAEPGAEVSVTSFEQSKWLSAGRGGLAATNNPELAGELRRIRDAATPATGAYRGWLFTLLVSIAGRAAYAARGPLTRRAMILAGRLDRDRLQGQSSDELDGSGIPLELAGAPDRVEIELIARQIGRMREVAAHRARIVGLYDRAAGVERHPLPLVRYPMLVPSPDRCEESFRRAGWNIAGRWFDSPLHPATADPAAFGLRLEAVPRAVELARHVINLPTHPLVTDVDAEQLISIALASGAKPLTRAEGARRVVAAR